MKISEQEWIAKGKQMFFEEFSGSYEIMESVKVEFASEEDWIRRRSEIAQLCGEASSKREQVQCALEHDDLASIQGEFIWGEFGRTVILKTELFAHPGLNCDTCCTSAVTFGSRLICAFSSIIFVHPPQTAHLVLPE